MAIKSGAEVHGMKKRRFVAMKRMRVFVPTVTIIVHTGMTHVTKMKDLHLHLHEGGTNLSSSNSHPISGGYIVIYIILSNSL